MCSDTPITRLPSGLHHIAIIMDGNGRWAERHNLPRTEGHKAGVAPLQSIVEHCTHLGLRYLTVYAFSTENWKRPSTEVHGLFSLLTTFVYNKLDFLRSNNTKINFIGDITKLPNAVQQALTLAQDTTKNATGLELIVALNYSGRSEIIHAVQTIIEQQLQKDIITEELFETYLYTAAYPDPDLIIRTGNEYRMSNFLLYQLAYSEFFFSPILWPDFTKEHLNDAIQEFARRKRRFGA